MPIAGFGTSLRDLQQSSAAVVEQDGMPNADLCRRL